MKLAYIEDDADARSLFAGRFRTDGWTCDEYGSAEEALPNIGPGSHDVLVTDIRLPGLNGVEFLLELRRRDVHTPCVLITAFGSLGLMKQAVNSAANYLLEKPFAYADLRRVIDRVLEPPSTLQYYVDRGLGRLQLTEREQDVARLLLKGLSNAEIASAASLSEKTVKQYVTQVFSKAGVQSRGEFFAAIFPV
ncbi:MAG: Transcriptional regulatory protein FixJ [Candidatus Omnitrophica bacterium]|nr:Transcriptional regulatory protein FixJ [Candidatus Omnitrophota bacterium]